jgi:hypothetical protein
LLIVFEIGATTNYPWKFKMVEVMPGLAAGLFLVASLAMIVATFCLSEFKIHIGTARGQ